MVKTFLTLFLAFQMMLIAEVRVTSSIENPNLGENQPIKGMISITHDASEKVDVQSIKLGNTPLKTQFQQDTRISPASNLIVSFYSFYLPGQPKGLYALPEVSVKVGNQTYKSFATTYEVGETAKEPPSPQGPSYNSPSLNNATLKLEGSYEGPSPAYPGQLIRLYYRYIFNADIELTVEKLPLLDAPGFRKVGSREVKDSQEGDTSIRVISQTVEANKAGTFEFPAGHIEGYAYYTNDAGVRQYKKPILQADSTPVAIVVSPFPANGRPASFNGAIGPFSSFSVALNSPSKVIKGDKLQLGVDITGTGNVRTVPLPDLCCQPGFSGMFKQGDLPPIEKVTDHTKHFDVELRPLFEGIKEIPSIEFSYFDPATKNYGVLRSSPIPITVQDSLVPQGQPPEKKEADQTWQQQPQQPTPIEVRGPMDVKPGELSTPWWDSWWIFLIIPLGLLVLALQRYRKKTQVPQQGPKPKTSEDILAEANAAGVGSPLFYQLLNKAFMMRLKEKGLIESTNIPLEKLPQEGKPGQVRDLLQRIEEQRYTGRAIDATLLKEAGVLFKGI